MSQLRLVHPEAVPHQPARVQVAFSLEKAGHEDWLVARFAVEALTVHVNPAFGSDQSSWGLWDWDVVELFVCANPDSDSNAPLPYYEFQLSPLGQWFELEIFEPRKRFNREFRSGFRGEVEQVPGKGWNATMRIPLAPLGWTGDITRIVGNAFSIQGEKPHRSYWSLFTPTQKVPDFHLPEHFRPLLI